MGIENTCSNTSAVYSTQIKELLDDDHGNVSVNALKRDSEGKYSVLFASNPTYRGDDRVDINFIDTDGNPTTFEGVWIRFSGKEERSMIKFFEEPQDRMALSDTAREVFIKERDSFLMKTGGNGSVNELSLAEMRTLIGKKPDGSPRKIAVVIPHQDDEVGVAGTLSYYIRNYGAENVMVLFTTNGDGLAWDQPASEREEYGKKKIALGQAACAKLGIPKENVRSLGTSEFEFYNSFISDNVKKADAEGKERPKDMQPDFRYTDNALAAIYYQAEWIYRNLSEFGADVVITSDVEYTVQMHDWTGVMTRLAVKQYAGEKDGEVLQLAFPQQNVNPVYNDKLLYSYYPDQVMLHGAMKVVLDDNMKEAKNGTIKNYQTNSTDRLLFVKYFFQFGPIDTANMKKYEFFHIVDNNDLDFKCPPMKEQGYPAFEGNDNHTGIPHDCEKDDFGKLPELLEYIRTHPFTRGPIEPFNSSLWYNEAK